MAVVTLSQKFENAEQFLAYAQMASGMDFVDQDVVDWFNANPDFELSYTGIMKVLNGLKVTETNPEKPLEPTE